MDYVKVKKKPVAINNGNLYLESFNISNNLVEHVDFAKSLTKLKKLIN